MIIERQVAAYVVGSQEPVARALELITANRRRVVFCLDATGRVEGSFSDGDFRRWIGAGGDLDLRRPVLECANTAVRTVPADAEPAEISRAFGPGIELVPMVDDRRHLVAIAVDQASELRIGRHRVADDAPALLIAEIGLNHQGSVALAKELVEASVAAGADVVKFQLRDLDALYRQGRAGSAGEDLGPQYTLDLLAKYDLPAERLFEVFEHCATLDVDVMCTAWDTPSVDRLAEHGIAAFKVASAHLTHHPLLRRMARHGLPTVVSTGMSTEAEIRESVGVLRGTGVPFALLHCQSTYPAPFKDLNLRYLPRLAEIGGCPVGWSGHERGHHVPVAAVALGARLIEKHVTTDRTLEGNDHRVSLLPHEFGAMVSEIRDVEAALGSAAPREISTGEQMNRVNLATSLVATERLLPGDVVTAGVVEVKSPGRGVQPNHLPALLGRVMRRTVEAGDFFYPTDLVDTPPRPRRFGFRRPWGLPVRYHDVAALTADSAPDFLEFHFSYRDLDLDPDQVLPESLPMGFTTHSPDLFAGDFLLNLASADDAHWERSIAELQRVVDLTLRLRPRFEQAEEPIVVASLGGFTSDAFVPPDELPNRYARVADGLARVDDAGVRLVAQTLPPFPWYLGGQLFCNLFVGPQDTAAFAEKYGRRLCLDVSHSKLAANHLRLPFSEVTAALAPHAEHLHLVDATGVDGEGVQVGDGEIDWATLARQLDEHAPGVSFIPEIWQGHVGGGEGFWVALDRLEEWF